MRVHKVIASRPILAVAVTTVVYIREEREIGICNISNLIHHFDDAALEMHACTPDEIMKLSRKDISEKDATEIRDMLIRRILDIVEIINRELNR